MSQNTEKAKISKEKRKTEIQVMRKNRRKAVIHRKHTFKGFVSEIGKFVEGWANQNRRGLNLMMEEEYGYRLKNRAKKFFRRWVIKENIRRWVRKENIL